MGRMGAFVGAMLLAAGVAPGEGTILGRGAALTGTVTPLPHSARLVVMPRQVGVVSAARPTLIDPARPDDAEALLSRFSYQKQFGLWLDPATGGWITASAFEVEWWETRSAARRSLLSLNLLRPAFDADARLLVNVRVEFTNVMQLGWAAWRLEDLLAGDETPATQGTLAMLNDGNQVRFAPGAWQGRHLIVSPNPFPAGQAEGRMAWLDPVAGTVTPVEVGLGTLDELYAATTIVNPATGEILLTGRRGAEPVLVVYTAEGGAAVEEIPAGAPMSPFVAPAPALTRDGARLAHLMEGNLLTVRSLPGLEVVSQTPLEVMMEQATWLADDETVVVVGRVTQATEPLLVAYQTGTAAEHRARTVDAVLGRAITPDRNRDGAVDAADVVAIGAE